MARTGRAARQRGVFAGAATVWLLGLGLLLAAALGGQTTAAAGAQGSEVAAGLALDDLLPQDPKVKRGRLDNGLTFYIRENRRPLNRAELRLAVNAGSILEDADQLGLAHFAEHMAFNGTKHFAKQELVSYLESIGMRFGADVNAYTSFDETVYMLQVPTDDRAVLARAFQILEDWAGYVSFDEAEIEKERGVVIEEWRIGRGASARLRDQQFPVLFKGSLYAERLPIGNKEVLESFSAAELRRFYRDWYRPDLMAVVAVGDFAAADIEVLVREHFGRLRNPESPRARPLAPVPDHAETLFSIVTDPELSRSSLSLTYKYDLEVETTVADYRRSLVEGLFQSALNMRLAERAREPAPPFLGAYSSQGGFVRTTGIYSLGAVVDEGGIVRGLEALLTEALRARRHGFVEAELARRKADLLRFLDSAYEEREQTESSVYAAEYVRSFLEAEPFPGIEYERALAHTYLAAITVAEVDAIASRWISDANRVILVEAPAKVGLKMPGEGDLMSVFATVEAATVAPYVDQLADVPLVAEPPAPGEVVERRFDEALGVSELRLKNGVRVLLKPTDFKNDEIAFTAWSPGGHSLVADDDFVAGSTAASVVAQGGLGAFDLIALDKHLAGKVVSVSPFIGELSEGLSGGGSPQDLDTLLQLVYLTFTAPRSDPDAFLSYQARMRGLVKNRRVIPEVVFSEAVSEALSQAHPRRRPFDEALVDAMDLEASLAIYRNRFADASDFTFLFVGAFTLEQIEPLIATYLGGLPTRAREESWRDVGVRPPPGVVKHRVEKGLEPKSRYRLIFTGPFEQSPVNRHLAQSLADLARIRLRDALREELGGTYGVSVSAGSSHFPISEYALSIGFACDPDQLETMRAALFAEIDRLKAAPASDLELTKLRETQRRERETDLRTNGFWLGALRYAYYHGEDPHEILSYDERVAGLSDAALQAAAGRYLDIERYVEVTLVPEAAEPATPAVETAAAPAVP